MALALILLQFPGLNNKYSTMMLLLIFNLFNAIADVVVDAIMVTLARNDTEHGSADLQTLHVISV